MKKLYSEHLPISQVSRLILAAGSSIAALANPARGDMVAASGEATALPFILQNIRERMESDDAGREILKKQPRITEETIDRKRLLSLPSGTFGREYAR